MKINEARTINPDKIRIASSNGVYDVRSKKMYSEIITSAKDKRFFVDGLEVNQLDERQYEVVKPSFDAENPIPYVEGMELVNNAFYLKDGKVYVWMNEWVEW